MLILGRVLSDHGTLEEITDGDAELCHEIHFLTTSDNDFLRIKRQSCAAAPNLIEFTARGRLLSQIRFQGLGQSPATILSADPDCPRCRGPFLGHTVAVNVARPEEMRWRLWGKIVQLHNLAFRQLPHIFVEGCRDLTVVGQPTCVLADSHPRRGPTLVQCLHSRVFTRRRIPREYARSAQESDPRE